MKLCQYTEDMWGNFIGRTIDWQAQEHMEIVDRI